MPSGPILHQKVAYEALPKFCNFCNVIGHTRILCTKAATAKVAEVMVDHSIPLGEKGNVLGRLGPQVLHQQASPPEVPTPSTDPTELVQVDELVDASTGWVTVESKRKAHQHSCKSPKGKEASVTGMEVNVNPSACAGIVSSPSVRESTTTNVVTRPSSSRDNPTLDADHDPRNRKCSQQATFANNRRSSPPRPLGKG
ncbi:hypothetical protein NC651_016342 [Populus alba x Populus x berolinensis]|nr:hypothetical protein NC651_016342 [Populus alba x Populus x berolinensis]